jgi:putative transposase
MEHKVLSISDRCEILGIHRSGLYYHTRGESALNMQLMNIIDREFFDKPFYGVRRMKHHLRLMGYPVN